MKFRFRVAEEERDVMTAEQKLFSHIQLKYKQINSERYCC